MIPSKLVILGDRAAGKMQIGLAKLQMQILENSMKYQGLKQAYRVVHPYPGTGIVIECWSSFGLREINITVPVTGAKHGMRIEAEQLQKCFCTRHFSMGQILRVYPPEPIFQIDPVTGLELLETQSEFEDRVADYYAWLITGRFYYDVEICSINPYIYIQYDVVYDANYGRYSPGQLVLVSFGQDMPVWETLDPPLSSTDCARECLITGLPFSLHIVSPVHSTTSMAKWRVSARLNQVIEE